MSDLVERLRALAEKATPGPWQVNGVRSKMRLAFGNHTFPVHDVGPDGDALAAVFFEEKTGRGFIDAKFIAACDPQTILALIARITELEGERDTATRALPAAEWHEDIGPVLWWFFPISEPPYVGTPNDLGQTVEITLRAHDVDKLMRATVGGWPGYHTHWTPMPRAVLSKTEGKG